MKKLSTIIWSLILIASAVFCAAGCTGSGEVSVSSQMIIDSLSARFIPDHRMGISDIKAFAGRGGAILIKGETTDPDLKSMIIKTLNNSGNIVIDSIITLPDTLHNKKYTGLVTLSVINIRKHPDHAAEMVSQSILGTPVRILKNRAGWSLIRTPDDYIGWAEESSLEPMTTGEMNGWKRSDRVITQKNCGWIYESAGGEAVIGDFVAGCIFVNEGKTGIFTKIRLPDGREGYVPTLSVKDFNEWRAGVRCTGESVIKCAATFTGLPYLWGGTSSRGVDCSGFSQSVFYLNGIILRRDASLQALHGTDVAISSGYGLLRPGDLLFFGTKDKPRPHVTHVAIYKGDNEYINSAGRVLVNSLDSTRSNYSRYREVSLLLAKRVIGVTNDPGIVPVRDHPWY